MRWLGCEKAPSLKSVTYIAQWWNLARLYLTKGRSKKYISHDTTFEFCWYQIFFSPEMNNFGILRNTYRLHFSTHFLTLPSMKSPKKLYHDSNYIVGVVMWPKFGNSGISLRFYYNINFTWTWPEQRIFEWCSWFKSYNFGLALEWS